MLELTPLFKKSSRANHPDEPTKGTPSWAKMLSIVVVIGMIALAITQTTNEIQRARPVESNKAMLVANVRDDLPASQCGPGAASSSPSHIYVAGRVIGCDGQFTGGLFSGEAHKLCDAATGWRICKSAQDAANQGLTTAKCAATPDKKFYATQQRGTGFLVCDGTGANDVFGCGKGLGLSTNLAASCSPLLQSGNNLFGHYNGNQWSCSACNPNGLDELEKVSHQLNGNAVLDGGVMCCRSPPTCPPGQYMSSGSCTKCPCGYSCSNNVKTICPAGEYQPKEEQTTCITAKCGYFVPSPGATAEEQCRAGTYSAAGAVRCTPTPPGTWTGPGACAPVKCLTGEFQDCDGQRNCLKAPCGHFAKGLMQTSFIPCPTGSYQPKEGQTGCIQTVPGQYVGPGVGHCKPRYCIPGYYSHAPSMASCIPAGCGCFVSTAAASKQELCPKGTYQPRVGQPNCLPIPDGYRAINQACGIECCPAGTFRNANYECEKAPCGEYVPNKCAMKSLPCPAGTYTDTSGQSSCTQAPLGYIPKPNKCGLDSCPAGTYQDTVGGTVCKDAKCGEFTPVSASSKPSKCPPGTFQDKTKQTSCKDCAPGSANHMDGQCSCPLCTPGTYQPLAGKLKCKDSPCGNFVSSSGATQPTPCPPGQYQDQTKQTGCIPAPAGTFAVGGKCAPEKCKPGSFTATDGKIKCEYAPCGFYVGSAGQTNALPCPMGKYQPLTGQTSCLDAPTGSYTSGTGKCSETLCTPGHYQPATGQTSCEKAKCGHYVAITGSATQSPCGPGRWQKDQAQTSCDQAALGYFVSGHASCTQEKCPAGTYTDCKGQSKCIKVPCGSFVSGTGASSITQCSAGFYQDMTGQDSCKPVPAGSYSEGGYCFPELCEPGTYQPQAGQSSCKPADCGNFVDGEGRDSQQQCAPGSYQPSPKQVGCLMTTIAKAPGPGTCVIVG